MNATDTIAARLEYLRAEIHAERISYGELAELQSLASRIEPGDVELLQWAGVPEFCDECSAAAGDPCEPICTALAGLLNDAEDA